MKRYIGCDPHATSCTFAVRDGRGKRVGHDVVETNGRSIIEYIRRVPGELHLCVEEGEQSQWLVELLRSYVAELVVVVPERRRGNKSDKIDAFGLAEVLRTNRPWKRVFKDPDRYRRLRELSRAYSMMSSDVVRTKNRIKSFYRGRGIGGLGTDVYKPGRRDRLAQKLPASLQAALELLHEELDLQVDLKARGEKALVEESRRHRIARVLETAPGLGPVRVAQMQPIVITPHRFRTSRQFWAYCGFGIQTRSSSDWVQTSEGWRRSRVSQTRGLNEDYNRTLKWIFKGAATTVSQHAIRDPLHADYQALLEKGTKPNLAKLTIARRIAAIVLAMWKQEQKYSPRRPS